MADLAAQHAPLEEELCAAFRRVVRSGHFVLGGELEALERECAALHGVRHAVGVSSGTDALLCALTALGVGPGDEVVTTPISFFATAEAIVRLGATPVFADVGEDLLLDPEAAVAAVGPRTRAIVTIDLFGRVARAPAAGVPVVEDAAQAFGAARVGRGAAAAALSFYPTKNLGALGDGGLVLTDDGALAERVRLLRAHGQPEKHRHELVGGTFRLDELQAALLRVKLPHLAGWNARRRRHAERYREGLAGTPLALPRFAPGEVVHQFVVLAPDREALGAHLHARGIETDVFFPPMHRQPALAGTGARASCPRAEALAARTLALPVHAELPDESVERVVRAVREFFRFAPVP